MISLPISIGEGLDKLTILEIKYKNINDVQKKQEIKKEIDAIAPLLEPYKTQTGFYADTLYKLNHNIWDLCDMIRDKSIQSDMYSKLCIDIIENNDNRFRIKNKINLVTNSSLKEQKNYKMKKAVICPHLGLGDMFTMVGAIRYYSINYDEVTIFTKPHYCGTVKNIFADDNTIKIVIADDDKKMIQLVTEQYSLNDYKIFKVGVHLPNKIWKGDFYDDFYRDLNLSPCIRFSHFHIQRNSEYEKKLYDDTVGKLDNEYIFVHDKGTEIFKEFNLMDRDICVYHPNMNFYPEGHKYHHIWNGMHDNIVSYATIIENASEIYCIDSSFFCLATYLNLKATKRIVTTVSKWYNIKNYIHQDEQNKWTYM